MMLNQLGLFYLLVMNILGFSAFGIDKQRARKRKRRFSEQNLLRISVFGGGIGSLVGMYLFRHKTQKTQFQIVIPLSAFLTAFLLSLFWS